jgi:TRAP-type uncharacterized transport system substrate-binding protein
VGRWKSVMGRSVCWSAVVCVGLAFLFVGNVRAGEFPPRACCTADSCRLYVIAGPTGSTYLEMAARLKKLLEEPTPGEPVMQVKLLSTHERGYPLHGSVHNLFYLMHLAGLTEGIGNGRALHNSLEDEDLAYVGRCSMALTQADVAFLTYAGILQSRMMMERALGQANREPDIGAAVPQQRIVEQYRTRLCQSGNDSSGSRDWLFSPEFHCGQGGRTRLSAVVSLYREALHLVVRYPLGLTDMSQLSDFKVFVGPLGSGTRVTATSILNASGLKVDRFAALPLDTDTPPDYLGAIDCTRGQTLDAFFAVSTPPFFPVRTEADSGGKNRFVELLRDREAHLHSLPTANLLRLTEMFPLFASMEIPAESYPGQTAAVSTVGIDVLLVVPDDFPPSLVRFLLEKLLLNESKLREMVPIVAPTLRMPVSLGFSGLEESLALSAITVRSGATDAEVPARQRIPYHGGTTQFFELDHFGDNVSSPGLIGGTVVALRRVSNAVQYGWSENAHLALLFSIVFGILLLLAALPRSRVWVIRAVNAHPFGAATAAIVILLLFAGTLTFLAEHRRSDFFSNPAEALFSVVVYLFSGFEDRAPVTFFGRAGSTTILVISPLMVALLTGAVFRLVQRQISEGYIIPRRLSNHYVVCGWNDRALGIVLQLRDELLEKMKETAPIVIVGVPKHENAFAEAREQHPDFMHDVRIIARKPTDPMALYHAHVARSRAVIVLAEGENDDVASLVVATLKSLRSGWEPERNSLLFRARMALLLAAAWGLTFWHRAVGRAQDLGSEGKEPVSTAQQAGELARTWRIGWREPVVLVESLEMSGALQDQQSYGAGSNYLGKPQDALRTFAQQGSVGPNYRVLKGERLRTRALAAAARSGRGGVVEALFQLLTFGSDTNEIYEVKVAQLFSPRRFAQLATMTSEAGIPFAYLSRELYRVSAGKWKSPMVCVSHRPEGDRRFRTNPGHLAGTDSDRANERCGLVSYRDSLLVMAYSKPSRRWR